MDANSGQFQENIEAKPQEVDELKERIVDALRTCYDPEIPVNIYELGLIYNIDVDSQANVNVRMTLTSPGCPVAGSLPPEVQYACLYWVQHLQRGGSQVCDGEEAHRFLQAHLLHWLEALGWMGKASEGIQAILSLEAHVPVSYLSIVYRSLTNLSLGK